MSLNSKQANKRLSSYRRINKLNSPTLLMKRKRFAKGISMERQGCFVWDGAILCVSDRVCVCGGGVTGFNKKEWE